MNASPLKLWVRPHRPQVSGHKDRPRSNTPLRHFYQHLSGGTGWRNSGELAESGGPNIAR